MSDVQQAPEAEIKPKSEPPEISFAEFLETVPPSQMRNINDLTASKQTPQGTIYYPLSTPELLLHCNESNVCSGVRIFRFNGGRSGPPIIPSDQFKYEYLPYLCSNCRQSTKVFSVAARRHTDGSESGLCHKFGEFPAYGPLTSSRLITLIGPDRELFLKGRQSESQGLGIGAFAYYRRVVENQKDRILGNILKLATKISASTRIIAAIQSAIDEKQFSKAVDSIKDAIPQSLLIDGHNPITLLHSALSDGLHAKDDERCLEIAHDIRVVLAELSERLAAALKDEKELGDAVSRLLKKHE
jgi:hypothetical protein